MKLTEKLVIDELQSNLDGLSLLECRRLFHGRGGVISNAKHFNIEKYGQWITIVFYADLDEQYWINLLRNHLSDSQYYLAIQRRWQSQSPWEFTSQTPPEIYQVEEDGLKYQLRFDRQNPGLFLDMRTGRYWVRQHSQGKKIANLFSYTCGFSVTGAAGGAVETVNLDMSKAALSQGRTNLQLNGNESKNRFLAHDISKSLGKITRLGPYDLVIIDPPTKQRNFDPLAHYNRILRRCHEWVVPGGWLMLTLNDPVVSLGDFLEQSGSILSSDFIFEQRLENPVEIKEQDPKLGLKVVLYRRL